MNFMPNDREPVYLQIIRYIKQKVVRGELNPGDTIPSRREMAQILKVNPNTVQKSYKEMEEMGIINTIKSYQSSITTDENVINKARNKNEIHNPVSFFIPLFFNIRLSLNFLHINHKPYLLRQS